MARLAEHARQLRGIGINLDQLAHAANAGRPVVVDQPKLERIERLHWEIWSLLIEVRDRLPHL